MYPFSFLGGAAIDAQAQAHYDRVIADGGLVPSGLSGVNAFFTTVKTIYATSDITTAISVGLDAQVLGYKLGAGAGTTLGQAAQKLYSCSGASGDVEQTTAASQPLLLVYEGVNYWWSSGVSGNYCSTPNSAANQITGDIEIIVKLNIFDISASKNILGKFPASAGNFQYEFALVGNKFSFFFSQNGTSYIGIDSSSIVGIISNNTNYFIKFTRVSSSGTYAFYYSTDGITYTLINNGTSTSGSMYNGNAILEIGAAEGGASPFNGKIYRVTLSNTIGGNPVVDFNPSQYNAATSQTQWTSSTGEIWSVQTGTATTGYKGVLVDRTITMFDGIEDFLQNPTILRGDICSQYLVYKTENAIGSGITIIDSASSAWQNAFTPESSNMRLYMNGSAGNVSKSLNTLLTMYTTTNNQGVSNSIQKNNDTPTTNAYTPALSGTGLSIGKLANLAFYQKGNVQTYISAIGVNTTTIRTDMYNYIRSINNSAF
jgi:hypothetical protein